LITKFSLTGASNSKVKSKIKIKIKITRQECPLHTSTSNADGLAALGGTAEAAVPTLDISC
jgi:hypothetical protein